MKIAQSNVNLVSSSHYYEENTVSISSGVMTRESFLDNLQRQGEAVTGQDKIEESSAKNAEGKINVKSGTERSRLSDLFEMSNNQSEISMGSDNYNNLKSARSAYLTSSEESLHEQIARIRANLLESLLSFLQLIGGDKARLGYKETLGETANMLTENSFVSVTSIKTSHVEEEATSFSGQGIALTEDGRQIDFNVNFSLSRRFESYAGVTMARAANLIDPLVINVGSDVTSISDQSFYFDIDCDGKEDKIRGLGPGTGFLTYDMNGDGIINDGSELFGTKSGDGFKDLARYDSDGNGWIDENDEVYGKLQVWLRSEDGEDTLLSLKEADVGAIYLGSATTAYTYYGDEGAVQDPSRLSGGASYASQHDEEGYANNGADVNNGADANNVVNPASVDIASSMAVTAMMRASGLFLRESGGVGTVHQIDLARM